MRKAKTNNSNGNKRMVLYHITLSENISSIKQKGILPSIGYRVRHCSRPSERNTKEPKISLCEYKDIQHWRTAIYSREHDSNISVIKVDATNIHIKFRRWSKVLEYATWELIPNDNIIEVFKYTEFNF